MRTIFLLFCGCILSLHTLNAQSFETDKAAQANIQKLEFLTGKWEGSGWMMGQDGTKYSFNQSENV